MAKKYQITPLVWLVRDEASVKFHVTNNDYFGTIATILSLIKQQIKTSGVQDAASLNKIFQNLENDLLYLQNHYQIKPKSRKKNMTPKGKLISQ